MTWLVTGSLLTLVLPYVVGTIMGWLIAYPGRLSDRRMQERATLVLADYVERDPDAVPWLTSEPVVTCVATAYVLGWRDAGGSLE